MRQIPIIDDLAWVGVIVSVLLFHILLTIREKLDTSPDIMSKANLIGSRAMVDVILSCPRKDLPEPIVVSYALQGRILLLQAVMLSWLWWR